MAENKLKQERDRCPLRPHERAPVGNRRQMENTDLIPLTELGKSFIPFLQTMMAWIETYLCPDYENPYN